MVRNPNEFSYGMDVATGRRVSFPRSAHDGKMLQIRGITGGGKSMLMTQLHLQYLEPYTIGRQKSLSPLCIIDLGGDLFGFNMIKKRCEELGRTFKWLSLDPLDQSFTFDPLQGCQSLAGSASRKANFVTAGLNLAYAEGFGTGYFGRLNFSTIREAFVRLEKKGVASPSLHQLGEELSLMAKRQKGSKEAAEALYALDQLLDYDVLTPNPDPSQRIDIAEALEECHVLYFFLPTLQEPMAARAVGTLAAWSVIHAAAHRQKTGKAPRTIPLTIDEAAQIVHGQSFQDALVLSRKYGIRISVLYQSEAQLKSSRGTDMSQVVADNCSIKAFFSTDTKKNGEIDSLLGHSKSEIVPRLGYSQSGLKTTTSQQEHEEPILKRNDVVDCSSTFGEYYLVFHEGGHREPIRVRSEFPTTKEVHAELSNRPIPPKVASVSQPTAQPAAAPAATGQRVTLKPPLGPPAALPQQAANNSNLLSKLLASLKIEEAWKLGSSS